MRYLLFLPVLLCFLVNVSAQREFAPSGATWYYAYHDSAFGLTLFNGYEEIRYDRDTLIENRECKVLTRKVVGEVDEELVEYYQSEKIIYQDGYQVYAWANERFFLLYDFGLSENETVRFSGGNDLFDSCYAEYRVDSVYYEEIDGEDLKNIQLDPIGGNSGPYVVINEKFGGLAGHLFATETACILDWGQYYRFRCYEDDEFAHYQLDTIACDEYQNVSQLVEISKIGISINPNPIEDAFLLENTSGEMYDLTVFDINGHLMDQAFGIREGLLEIDCSQWAPGTFVVQISTGGQRAYKKLLKI